MSIAVSQPWSPPCAGSGQIEVRKPFGLGSAIGEMVYWHFHRKVTGTPREKYWFAAGTALCNRCFHVLDWLDSDDKLVLNLCVTARRLPRATLPVSESSWALAGVETE